MSRIVTAGSVKRTFTCPHCNKQSTGNPDTVASWIQRHIRFCEGMSPEELNFCLQAIGKTHGGMRHKTRLVNGKFEDYSPEIDIPTHPMIQAGSSLSRVAAPAAAAPAPIISDEERARIWAELIADEEADKKKKKNSGKKKA